MPPINNAGATETEVWITLLSKEYLPALTVFPGYLELHMGIME